jgi:hypothetical protein
LIFWGNATSGKVQKKLGWTWTGSKEFQRVSSPAGSAWVASSGRKNTICTDTHYRLYALERDRGGERRGAGRHGLGPGGSPGQRHDPAGRHHVDAGSARQRQPDRVAGQSLFLNDGLPTLVRVR